MGKTQGNFTFFSTRSGFLRGGCILSCSAMVLSKGKRGSLRHSQGLDCSTQATVWRRQARLLAVD
jgi:hypothetical protein